MRRDPRLLVIGVIERVQELADAKQVDLIIQIHCGDVWVNPLTWASALYELVLNAVRATRQGHPVVVDVTDVEDGESLWQVQDVGSGMSAEQLALLDQHDASGGIGRAWRVFESHGALLCFESGVGVGTTASILLPGASR